MSRIDPATSAVVARVRGAGGGVGIAAGTGAVWAATGVGIAKIDVKALEYFKANRWNDVRTIDDLEEVLVRYPDTQPGNTELARYLWGNTTGGGRMSFAGSRAFRSIGVLDGESLRAWAQASEFEGRVKGLGPAVYQWLVMRQGVDTVKPDVHVRRFAEAAVGRSLSEADIKAFELDWRIWEAPRGGALPYLCAGLTCMFRVAARRCDRPRSPWSPPAGALVCRTRLRL